MRVEYHWHCRYLLPVRFVPKEELAPLFGRAIGHVNLGFAYAKVRNDLSPRIRSFVIQHELYHLTDRWRWWGKFGEEIRANLVPGIANPIDLIATVFATLCSRKRIALYIDRLRYRY